MDKENIYYTEYGCQDRNEYLENLALDYGVSEEIVYSLADMFGESEDFDGLISALEDLE